MVCQMDERNSAFFVHKTSDYVGLCNADSYGGIETKVRDWASTKGGCPPGSGSEKTLEISLFQPHFREFDQVTSAEQHTSNQLRYGFLDKSKSRIMLSVWHNSLCLTSPFSVWLPTALPMPSRTPFLEYYDATVWRVLDLSSGEQQALWFCSFCSHFDLFRSVLLKLHAITATGRRASKLVLGWFKSDEAHLYTCPGVLLLRELCC
jgi:hypothetical protein